MSGYVHMMPSGYFDRLLAQAEAPLTPYPHPTAKRSGTVTSSLWTFAVGVSFRPRSVLLRRKPFCWRSRDADQGKL
jgi:hypothetical protein